MRVARLLVINGLIRVAAAATGQLVAFLLAERMSARVGTGAALVGLVGASYFVAELAGAPIAGRLADRRGQRRILSLGPLFGIASAVVAAAAAFTQDSVPVLIAVLLLARLNEGLSAACAVPTTLVLLARATDGDPVRRMRIMGLFEITSLIGMVLGFALGGLGWDALGPGMFLTLAALYGGAWLLIDRQRRPEPQPPRAVHPVLATLGELARTRGNVGFAVAWLAVNAVVGVWIQQAPYLLKLPQRSELQGLVGGFSGGAIGAIFAVWGLTFLVGLGLWSWFGARWPRRRVLLVALAGMLGVVATLAAANHGAPRLVLGAAAVCILIESGFTPAAFAHLADITRRLDTSRGAALGLYAMMLGTGQLAGNVLGAPFAAKWQMDGVLLFTGLMAVIALGGVARVGAAPSSSTPEPR